MSTPPPTQESEDGSGDSPREERRDRTTPRDDRGGADVERSGADAERPELAEVGRLRDRVSELEAALERKDQEMDAVRRQYEALLQGRGDDGGGVTWRSDGERWEGDVELEYASRAACGPGAESGDPETGAGRSGGSRLRSLFR